MVYGLCMEANRTARLSSWPPSCLASKKSATMQDSLALLVEDWLNTFKENTLWQLSLKWDIFNPNLFSLFFFNLIDTKLGAKLENQ